MIIDVSYHNGKLNWDDLKSRIDGAILRCGFGSDLVRQDDQQWARNVSECERLGIPYGVYLYSYARNAAAAKSEAAHVIRLAKGHHPQLPVFFDAEEISLGRVSRITFAAFRDALKDKYRVGLYTGEAYYNTYMVGSDPDYLWIAKYGKNDGVPHAKPSLRDNAEYHLWQYTSNGMGGGMDVSLVMKKSVMETPKETEKFPHWVHSGDKWYLRTAPGQNAHGFCTMNHHMYYFDDNGEMLKGWFKVGGNWYYGQPDGDLEGAIYRTDDKGVQNIWRVS